MLDDLRNSDVMEGGVVDSETAQDEEAYARGEIDLDELGRRIEERFPTSGD